MNLVSIHSVLLAQGLTAFKLYSFPGISTHLGRALATISVFMDMLNHLGNNAHYVFDFVFQTGPKGVLTDWREYKRLETEKREDQEKQRLELAKKLSITCRSEVQYFSHLDHSSLYTVKHQ